MVIDKKGLEQMKRLAKDTPHAAYEVGEYYYLQGEYKTAVEWYRKAVSVQSPDPLALFALGYAYQTGQGAPVDLIQALHYYEAAAERDVPQAYYNLAFFYQNGIAVSKDDKRAEHYIIRASECLKSITEQLFEAKSELAHMQYRYDDTVQLLAKKSDDWLGISKEREQLRIVQTQQESQISNLSSKLLEYETTIERYKQEISKHETAYDTLVSTHQKALHLIDNQNENLRKVTGERENAYTYAYDQKEQVSILNGRVAQLEKEIEDLLFLQNESLACLQNTQRELDKSQVESTRYLNKIQESERTIASRDVTIAKMKKNRWVFFGLGVSIPIALVIVIMIL